MHILPGPRHVQFFYLRAFTTHGFRTVLPFEFLGGTKFQRDPIFSNLFAQGAALTLLVKGPVARHHLNTVMDRTDVDGSAQFPGAVAAGVMLDPEDDARDALISLRGYLLSEMDRKSAEEVQTWDELDSYIEDLCSRGLDTLAREPDALAAEGARLRSQLDDAACKNYRALIQSFECAGAVRDGVGRVRLRLDNLVDALPPLANATQEFSSNAAAVQAQRESRLRTLVEYGRVLDMLEIPRLMRSLVAGELYDDALELHDMSLKLASLNPDEAIVMSICSDIDALTAQMMVQLLALLRGSVQLPTCLHVVGFMRRLSIFSEPRLRMIFLHCRGDWMRSVLDTSASPNAQAKLVRLSDDTRSMVFEIITQYRAAFADDDPSDASEDPYEGINANDVSGMDNPVNTNAILFDWTVSLISQYLTRLEEGLADIRDGASLCTVLQQAMYCGQSLGRVGADFRPVLAPLFEAAVMRVFNSHLSAALRQFEMMIEDQRWAPVGSTAIRNDQMRNFNCVHQGVSSAQQTLAGGIPKNSEQDTAVASNMDEDNIFEPPMALLDSPPLAVFLNGILAAFNELRSCALLSLTMKLGEKVSDTLLKAAECVSTIGGPGGAFLKRTDRLYFWAMYTSFRDLCVPHVARCLDHCMGQTGLVDVQAVVAVMSSMFGEPVPAVSQVRHAEPTVVAPAGKQHLNGGVVTVEDGDESPVKIEGREFDAHLFRSGAVEDADTVLPAPASSAETICASARPASTVEAVKDNDGVGEQGRVYEHARAPEKSSDKEPLGDTSYTEQETEDIGEKGGTAIV
jgi:conserved oligomeric Golgi complex subunit 8